MANRTISIPDELDARVRALPRAELPSLSKLLATLLERELNRREKVAKRRTEKP